MPAKRRRQARPRAIFMDQAAKGWLVNTAIQNIWRAPKYFTLDDLIEDGVICYYVVRDRYPAITSPAHIMALFQTTFLRHIKRFARKPEHDCTEVPENVRCSDGAMLDLVANAPAKLALLFLKIMRSPDELASDYERYTDGTRQTTNEKLCRLVGLDPEQNNLADDAAAFLRGWA